jgi:CO/xanthine dehydrogenase Mo-binding subunit
MEMALSSAPLPETEYRWIGTEPVRPDGVEKVTGQAKYGADLALPNMLWGEILRSPHAHARIREIDVSEALKLPGVKAVIKGADLPDHPWDYVGPSRIELNYAHMIRGIIAREKALFEGHAVAAIAATSPAIAQRAAKLIRVDYEVLPHVIDAREAARPDAPLLYDNMVTRGEGPAPKIHSNIAKQYQLSFGDIDQGFSEADVVVEHEFTTKPVHQGYIEPNACVAHYNADGQSEIWCSSQGHFRIRQLTAKLLDIRTADLRVTPAEIGGGFGGKTVVYLEPIALVLSKISGRPVKMVMKRDEVFKATGPAAGSHLHVRIGAKRDGTIVAAKGVLHLQGGAFPGGCMMNACMTAFAAYEIKNAYVVGFEVVSNRPKVTPYRAPGAPIGAFAVESALDLLAKKLGIDPIDLRLRNAAKEGTKAVYGVTYPRVGFVEALEAIKDHSHYKAPLGKNQGRGVAGGFWWNGGGDSCATLNVGEDGSVVVITGSVDVGGSRAAMAMMAAETLGIDYAEVRSIIGDTASIGFTTHTGNSRVVYATGMAVQEAAKNVIQELCQRAAKIHKVDPDAVVWEAGFCKPTSANAGEWEPMSLREIAASASKTGGSIIGNSSISVGTATPAFVVHICDVEVDPDTGKTKIVRWTAAQDVGCAIHKGYVEGQVQGGVVQGIGWALNEEYFYDEKGLMKNAGFLDYRMPVTLDLPMIDVVLVEVGNPSHTFGAKGVGEVNICGTMAAVANAIEDAIGVRAADLPISPPRLRTAIAEVESQAV